MLLLLNGVSCAGCEPPVDCEALCSKSLACEVTFDAPDDPIDAKIESGERTELESCVMGCNDSSLVTQESAQCIEDLESENAAVCQQQVLDCLAISDY
jgi:hypothetical protein